MKINFKRTDGKAQTPTYATDGSGAFDFYALDSKMIMPQSSSILRTGISVEVPEGYVMLIFSRSGHGFNSNIRLSNCVGVVDSDYRGEVMISLYNDAQVNYLASTGSRIAQGILFPVEKVEFVEVESLSETDRGMHGFGSTGG